MRKAQEYRELAERCRAAKLAANEGRAKHSLATLERSYSTLASSAEIVAQAEARWATANSLKQPEE